MPEGRSSALFHATVYAKADYFGVSQLKKGTAPARYDLLHKLNFTVAEAAFKNAAEAGKEGAAHAFVAAATVYSTPESDPNLRNILIDVTNTNIEAIKGIRTWDEILEATPRFAIDLLRSRTTAPTFKPDNCFFCTVCRVNFGLEVPRCEPNGEAISPCIVLCCPLCGPLGILVRAGDERNQLGDDGLG